MDPYAILGLNPSATPDDIKRAWRRLARVHHPDRQGGTLEKMAEINTAYNMLMDAEIRSRYDKGEGFEVPPIDVAARQALMQIVFAGLTQEHVNYGVQDLYDFIGHNIKNNVDKFTGIKATAERSLARCDTQRRRMTFKVADNPIAAVFEQVETGYREQLEKAQRDIQVMKRCREFFDEYVLHNAEVPAQRELRRPAPKVTFKGVDFNFDGKT